MHFSYLSFACSQWSTAVGMLPWPSEGTYTHIFPSLPERQEKSENSHLLASVHHSIGRNSSCCSPAFVLCSSRVRWTELWEVHSETGCTLRFLPYFRSVLPVDIQLHTCSWRRLNPHSMWMYLRQNRWHFFLCACLVREGRCNHVFSCRTDRLDGNYHSKIKSQASTAMRFKANQIQVIKMSPEWLTFGISSWFFEQFWFTCIVLESFPLQTCY